jgi:6-phosphogluconolactonase
MSTFVYISNAEDGEIAVCLLTPTGDLEPRGHGKAAASLGPLAISPDRRFLYAASRAKPFSVHVFGIDPATGALAPRSVSPLAESCPYLSLDRTGRVLFGASYGAHRVTVNEVGGDGRVVPEPRQVIPAGRHAHAIVPDRTNRWVLVPCLGTDQVAVFGLEAGMLRPRAAAQMKAGTGPRHLAISGDNRHVYVLGELTGSVTTFELREDGVLAELATAALPTSLRPGAPRGPDAPPRDREQDVWAADIHLTPDGRFLYTSERTTSTLGAYRVDGAGRLTWLAAVPTEKQPRGFAIDPQGRFLVAAGEQSTTLSVHAIGRDGALGRARQFPGGRGGNWVEIVAF